MYCFSYDKRMINGAEFKRVELTTGDRLEVMKWGTQCKPNCRFVKVTRKGFNIIDLDSNRAILKQHIYGLNMKDKEYPSSGTITINCFVPSWLIFRVTKSGKKEFDNPIEQLQV